MYYVYFLFLPFLLFLFRHQYSYPLDPQVWCKPGRPTLLHPYHYLRVILSYLLTYNELVTSRVHPQQHKQPTNTTTMVMEPLTPPAAWVQ